MKDSETSVRLLVTLDWWRKINHLGNNGPYHPIYGLRFGRYSGASDRLIWAQLDDMDDMDDIILKSILLIT